MADPQALIGDWLSDAANSVGNFFTNDVPSFVAQNQTAIDGIAAAAGTIAGSMIGQPELGAVVAAGAKAATSAIASNAPNLSQAQKQAQSQQAENAAKAAAAAAATAAIAAANGGMPSAAAGQQAQQAQQQGVQIAHGAILQVLSLHNIQAALNGDSQAAANLAAIKTQADAGNPAAQQAASVVNAQLAVMNAKGSQAPGQTAPASSGTSAALPILGGLGALALLLLA